MQRSSSIGDGAEMEGVIRVGWMVDGGEGSTPVKGNAMNEGMETGCVMYVLIKERR